MWLNNVVGERNYRWFLSFLALHSMLLFYGAVFIGSIFLSDIVENDLLNATFYSRVSGEKIQGSYKIVAQVRLKPANHLLQHSSPHAYDQVV